MRRKAKMVAAERNHGFSQNQLKVIGAIAMAVDHIGAEIFPGAEWMRIIGRLAFPIFSFFIYEGFCYTRSRFKYLMKIAGLGLICVAAYYIYTGTVYANVLITLSLSICLMGAVRFLTDSFSKGKARNVLAGLSAVLLSFACVFLFCRAVPVDYGFYGAVLPVFPLVIHIQLEKYDIEEHKKYFAELISFAAMLVLLSFDLGGIQFYSLLSIPFLFLYTGLRGKMKMKNFFYLFYPLHLLLIGLVAMII